MLKGITLAAEPPTVHLSLSVCPTSAANFVVQSTDNSTAQPFDLPKRENRLSANRFTLQ